jgi:hypothetical protein
MLRLIIIIIEISALFAIVAGVSVSWALLNPPQRNIPTEEEIPDKLLLDKANDLAEVKAFRNRYGEPDDAYVYRAYGLDVYYVEREREKWIFSHTMVL